MSMFEHPKVIQLELRPRHKEHIPGLSLNMANYGLIEVHEGETPAVE